MRWWLTADVALDNYSTYRRGWVSAEIAKKIALARADWPGLLRPGTDVDRDAAALEVPLPVSLDRNPLGRQ